MSGVPDDGTVFQFIPRFKVRVGLELESNGFEWSVYPNPTNGLFNINYPNPGRNAYIDVHNCLGVLVNRITTVSEVNILDLSNLSGGIYIVKILRDNIVLGTKKIMIR